MKIALINENSQAAKNAIICDTLKKVVEPMGHEVDNYGMYSAEDANSLTYVQIGILTAVLINSGAADFVITGCGTGGYPKERVIPEQRNKKILDQVKEVTHVDLVTILQNLDQDLVKGALGGAQFKELFYANCKCEKIAAAVEAIVGR